VFASQDLAVWSRLHPLEECDETMDPWGSSSSCAFGMKPLGGIEPALDWQLSHESEEAIAMMLRNRLKKCLGESRDGWGGASSASHQGESMQFVSSARRVT